LVDFDLGDASCRFELTDTFMRGSRLYKQTVIQDKQSLTVPMREYGSLSKLYINSRYRFKYHQFSLSRIYPLNSYIILGLLLSVVQSCVEASPFCYILSRSAYILSMESLYTYITADAENKKNTYATHTSILTL
jgi:hypothetical protein